MDQPGVLTFVFGVVGAVAGYATGVGPYAGYLVGTALGAVVESFVVKGPEDEIFKQESILDNQISNSALGETVARVYGTNMVPGKFIWASPKIEVEHRERDPSSTPEDSKTKAGGEPGRVTVFKTYQQHFALGLCEGPILRVTRFWMDGTLVFDVAQPSRFIMYTADARGVSTTGDTLPVLAKGADQIGTAQRAILFTGTEEQEPSEFIEGFEGQGNVPAYRGIAYIVLQSIDLGTTGRVPNFTFEVVQSIQSTGTPVGIVGVDGGAWTAWKTEVAEGVEGYGSGDTIFYNNTVANPDKYGMTGGRGVNYIAANSLHVLVCNGIDENVYIFDSAITGGHVLGPVRVNISELPSIGPIKGDKVIIEHQQVIATSRTITRNEGSYIDDGIVYGSRIQITGSQAGNNGTYTVETVVSLTITVFEALIGDEEAESFTITVLGHGGRVGLVGAAFGMSGVVETVCTICETTQDVRLFKVSTTLVIEHLALGVTPNSILYKASASLYYISCRDDGVVKVVSDSGSSLTLVDTVTFGGEDAGDHMLLADNGFVYITEAATDSVWKFTDDTDKIQITTNVGPNPRFLGLATDGFIWVANYSERSVSRIDPTANTVEKFTLPIFPNSLVGGDDGSMWVACEADSVVINISPAGTVGYSVQVPRFPVAMSRDTDNNIWLICDTAKTVAMIQGSRVILPESNNGLACVVRKECERVGLLPEEIDVSGLDVQPISMTIATVVSARTVIEYLAQAYQFTGIESGFNLRFAFKSDAFTAANVKQAYLAATANEEPPAAVLPIVRHDILETPTSVVVTAQSRMRSYNADSQSAKLNSIPENIHNIVKMDMPLVLNRYEMKNIAENLLYELLSQRQSYRISLPPRFLLIEPFDVVNIESTIDAEYEHICRLTEATIGNNLDMEGTASDYKRHVYAGFRNVPAVSLPAVVRIPDQSVIYADYIEPPFFNGKETTPTTPRYFVALYSSSGVFKSSVAFISTDNEETYNFLLGAQLPAISGDVTGEVPEGTVWTWDEETTIEVTLNNSSHTLRMSDQDKVLAGANVAFIGREVVQYTTATLTAPGTYNLSGLLRGRMGTEDQVALHAPGERFILIDDFLLENLRAEYELRRLGLTSHYKVFPATGNIVNADPTTFATTGRSLQAWSPVITKVEQDGHGDWTVEWVHRSRTSSGWWIDGSGITYDPDDTGEYQVTLYLDGEVSLQTTVGAFATAEETRRFTHTRVEQITRNIFYTELDVGIRTRNTTGLGIEARSGPVPGIALTGNRVLWTEDWSELLLLRTTEMEETFESATALDNWNVYSNEVDGTDAECSVTAPLVGTRSLLVTLETDRRMCFFPGVTFSNPVDLVDAAYRLVLKMPPAGTTGFFRAGIYVLTSQEDITGALGNGYLIGIEHSASNSRALGVWKMTGGLEGTAVGSTALGVYRNAWSLGQTFSLDIETRYAPESYAGLRFLLHKGTLNFEVLSRYVDATDWELNTPITTGLGCGIFVESGTVASLEMQLDSFRLESGDLRLFL